jgi:hypothetical protein
VVARHLHHRLDRHLRELGHLTAHAAGPTSGSVRLYGQPYGGTKTLLKTGALTASGNASFTVKPSGKTTYTAEFVEDDTYASSTSSGRTISVRSRTTVALSGGYGTSGKYRLYHVGKKAYMRGRPEPRRPLTQVRGAALCIRGVAHDRDRLISHAVEQLSYAYFYTNLRASYRARCLFAGDADHLASTSTWKYFKFTSEG